MSHAFQKRQSVHQGGYVLISVLLLLVMLTLISLFVSNVSVNEIRIAGNNKAQRQAFSRADGGTEAGIILLEENYACANGFNGPPPLRIGLAEVTADIFPATASRLNFWINEIEPAVPYPSDSARHVRFPNDDTIPHTNLYFRTLRVEPLAGMSMEFSHYGGPPVKGFQRVNMIDSRYEGTGESAAQVWVIWRHVENGGGTCRY